jgi:formamidopyrimidine-DNA glycosylase
VPELPEVDALAQFLDRHCAGQTIDRCELASFAALKTFDPPLESLVGRCIRAVGRRGKYLLFDTGSGDGEDGHGARHDGGDAVWLVVHLARGGWVQWRDRVPDTRARPGSRGPLALRVGLHAEDLAPSPGFDVTEAGTEKRLALWVVRDPAEVEAVARLGPDPLDPAFDAATLGTRLAEEGGTVKNALTRQSVIAGVGNAYSDEALHIARISPFRPAARLTLDEVVRLHDAVVGVLGDALEREAGLSASELKGDKKRTMRVHGRTGEQCPECGDTIREVSYSSRSLQYCPTCQTGGKVLADRRLSRLVK